MLSKRADSVPGLNTDAGSKQIPMNAEALGASSPSPTQQTELVRPNISFKNRLPSPPLANVLHADKEQNSEIPGTLLMLT